MTPKDLEQSNKAMGALFMRLLTDSCKEKTKKALKYEGDDTIRVAFTVLGQVAGREMFSGPEVQKAMAGLKSNIDTNKLEELKQP